MPAADPPPDDDLIAYLDGELDDAAAERVEAELASDPATRARADEFRKSFDLLDYLPAPEPSAAFASRTLSQVGPLSAATVRPVRRRVWPEAVAWAVVVLLAAGIGFAGHWGWRAVEPAASELPLSDLGVIENLPLYAGVDDIDFARRLTQEGLFDTPPADADPPVRPPLRPADRDHLIEQYRGFTPVRRQQLRTLHQQLSDPATADRGPLLHTLDGYAVWLARLPDADRRRVLDATPADRLDAVRQVHERRWRESLPQRQQELLRHVSGPEERQELLDALRTQEVARRQEWEIARRQWDDASGKDRGKDWRPWPFDQPGATEQVDDFLRSAFGVDPVRLPAAGRKAEPGPGCRLTAAEVLELRDRREEAAAGQWFTYGALLLRLADKYPTLPRPRTGEPVVRPNQVPKGYTLPKEVPLKGRAVAGKWPDFAEEVARLTRDARETRLEPLGPCRPDEFTRLVEQFVSGTLIPKLTDKEVKALERLLGKWPDYPREMLRLAREKNLSVPDVTLPGDPDGWRRYYQLPSGKR